MKKIREHPSRSLGFLSQYHDGELSREETSEFDRHAERCAECRRAAAEYEAVLAMFRAAESTIPDASLSARISRRVDAEVRHRAHFRYVTLQIDLLWASVVAVGLVGVLALYGVIGRRKPETPVAGYSAPASPAAKHESENAPAAPPAVRPSAPISSRVQSRRTRETSSAEANRQPEASPSPGLAAGTVATGPGTAPKAEAGEPKAAESFDASRRDAAAEPLPVGGRVSEPVLIRRVEPIIPEAVGRRIVSGSPVVLEAIISESGAVTQVKLIRSNPPFDDAVIRAVRQWRYRPALLGGKPVPVYLTVTVAIDVR